MAPCSNASIASYTDPAGQRPGDTGNGIAVYNFQIGSLTPAKFPEHSLAECCARKDQERSFARAAAGEVDSLPRRTGPGAFHGGSDQSSGCQQSL